MRIGAIGAHARVDARERLSVNLRPGKLRGLARKLEHVAKDLGSDDANSDPGGVVPTRPWLSALQARLARRAGRVLVAIEAAGAVYAPEPLHGVRIAVKKLRYAAELARRTRHASGLPPISRS